MTSTYVFDHAWDLERQRQRLGLPADAEPEVFRRVVATWFDSMFLTTVAARGRRP